jgi:hypothetical protein
MFSASNDMNKIWLYFLYLLAKSTWFHLFLAVLILLALKLIRDNDEESGNSRREYAAVSTPDLLLGDSIDADPALVLF